MCSDTGESTEEFSTEVGKKYYYILIKILICYKKIIFCRNQQEFILVYQIKKKKQITSVWVTALLRDLFSGSNSTSLSS